MPAELDGRIDEVRVDLPWGSLLEGLLAGDPELLSGVMRMLVPGGRVLITLNARALPGGLPPEEAIARLHDRLASAGFSDVHVGSSAIRPETGWGKRLASGRPLTVILGEARTPVSGTPRQLRPRRRLSPCR